MAEPSRKVTRPSESLETNRKSQQQLPVPPKSYNNKNKNKNKNKKARALIVRQYKPTKCPVAQYNELNMQ